MNKIRLSLVSYLNTRPFLYGLNHEPVKDWIDISLDVPSEGARKLKAGEVDLGLVPVAVIPEIKGGSIVTDFCIGTNGAVKSVCLLGEVPVEEMTEIVLDHQSRTSVELLKLLCRQHWDVTPELMADGIPELRGAIRGRRGGLVIGDRAIAMTNQFPFCYDLGQVWNKHTGLPFVFAAWVTRNLLPKEFIDMLNSALAYGVSQIAAVAEECREFNSGVFDVHEYFTQNISYALDSRKKKAMKLFLEKMAVGKPEEVSG